MERTKNYRLIDLDGYSAYTLALSLTEASFTSVKRSGLMQDSVLIPMFMLTRSVHALGGLGRGHMLSKVPYKNTLG